MTTPELQALIRLLALTHEVLHDVVDQPSQIIPPGLWAPLRSAIDEFGDPSASPPADNEQRPLSHAFAALHAHAEATSSTPASESVLEVDDRLRDHGLLGEQLQLKLQLIEHAYADYIAHGRVGEIAKNDEGWFRRAGHRLRRFLVPAATAIDSLSNVPGFGFLSLVSEGIAMTDAAVALAQPVNQS